MGVNLKGPSKSGIESVLWATNDGRLFRIPGASADLIYAVATDEAERVRRRGGGEGEQRGAYLRKFNELIPSMGRLEGSLGA